MTRSLVGKHITAFVPGEGRVSGVVDSEGNSPSHGEPTYLIADPDDGRRPIEVRESEIRETRDP